MTPPFTAIQSTITVQYSCGGLPLALNPDIQSPSAIGHPFPAKHLLLTVVSLPVILQLSPGTSLTCPLFLFCSIVPLTSFSHCPASNIDPIVTSSNPLSLHMSRTLVPLQRSPAIPACCLFSGINSAFCRFSFSIVQNIASVALRKATCGFLIGFGDLVKTLFRCRVLHERNKAACGLFSFSSFSSIQIVHRQLRCG